MQTKFRNIRQIIAKHFGKDPKDPVVIACAEEITKGTSSETVTAQANAKVDAILKMTAQSASRSWTLLPEIFQPHAEAFCNATTLKYKKQNASDWMATISDWMTDGFTPEMVKQAVEEICASDRPTPISRPGSITYKLNDLKVRRANPHKQAQSNHIQETNQSIIERMAQSYATR